MNFTVKSMNEWLYPDDIITNAVPEARMTAVRGGSAGFQLLCTDLGGGRLRASFRSFGSAPYRAELFREISVNVPENTGLHAFTGDWETAKDYATRKAPFRVYDALEPIGACGVESRGGTEALYASFTVDPACRAGEYAGELLVECGCEAFAVPVTLTVADAVLPAETLKFTNWFTTLRMPEIYGVEPWSEEHWRVIEDHARLMRRMHQNVIQVQNVATEAAYIDGDGEYRFDFSKCGRLIKMCLGMGFKIIEGPALFNRDCWEAEEFKINTPKGRFKALSNEAYDYASAFFKAWRAFLEGRGWYDKLIQHVGDEPQDKVASEYRILSGIIRKFLPGVPLIDAVELHELQGSLDIWVPKNDFYTRNTEAMERLRALGDELWFYTCCIPGGHYCNRLLDMPLLRTRMLFWGNYRYDIKGFLHWGLNYFKSVEAAYEQTCPNSSPTTKLPAGDTHILYPLGGRVIGSMRTEVTKCGTEDYELLSALAKRDKAAADELCSVVFRAFNDCDNDPAVFDELHDRLVAAYAVG